MVSYIKKVIVQILSENNKICRLKKYYIGTYLPNTNY